MSELPMCALFRFSKRNGKIDKTMTGPSKGMMKLWALQNTSKTKACVIVNLENGKTLCEVDGRDDYPVLRDSGFEFELPKELIEQTQKETEKDGD